MNLRLNSKITNDVAILSIEGEVDLYSSPEVRKSIMSLINRDTSVLIVDLKNVSYMDSSGVATLIEGLQVCNKNNSRLALVSLRENVREVFELTRLHKIFEIYEDADVALEAINQ